jgi:hypothetical protein
LKRIMLIASLAAMVVISAVPALAQNNNRDDRGDHFQDRIERFEDNGFFFDRDRDRDRFDDDGFFFFGDDRFDNNDFDNNGSGVNQDFEQDADSGDVDQSFTVTGGGDNSNQCVGLQGTANTGNAQNQIGVIQYGSEADDFEFDEVGSSIDVSPTNTTTCDQQVNQAASAFGS